MPRLPPEMKNAAPAPCSPPLVPVPPKHPILDSFPRELEVRLTFKRGRVVVRETVEGFERPVDIRRSSETVSTIETSRELFVAFSLAREDKGSRHPIVDVEACVPLEGVTFGPDGAPVEVEAWRAAVKLAVDEVLADARARAVELLCEGIEAEKADA